MTPSKNPIPAQVSRRALISTSSLHQAVLWLDEHKEDGEHCPCCGQWAKIYKRSVHHTIARALISLYRLGHEENEYWVHVPTAISPACEVGKARWWGLVEEAHEPRPDGGRAGWWRLTDKGALFVRGLVMIPQHAHVFDNQCLLLSGPMVNIADALGTKFNLAELMSGDL